MTFRVHHIQLSRTQWLKSTASFSIQHLAGATVYLCTEYFQFATTFLLCTRDSQQNQECNESWRVTSEDNRPKLYSGHMANVMCFLGLHYLDKVKDWK